MKFVITKRALILAIACVLMEVSIITIPGRVLAEPPPPPVCDLCPSQSGKALEQCLCNKVNEVKEGDVDVAEMHKDKCVLLNRVLLIEGMENPIQKGPPLRSQNTPGFNGTAHFTGCQLKTWQSWKDWVGELKSGGKVNGSEQFAPYWHHKINEFLEDENKFDQVNQDNAPLYKGDIALGIILKGQSCLKDKIEEMEEMNFDQDRIKYPSISKNPKRTEKFKSLLVELAGESNTWFKEIKVCSGLIALTAFHVDYNNSDFIRPSGVKASFDKKISCRGQGVETQDYPACLNIINIYNAAMTAQPVLQTVQGIDYQDHMSEVQHKHMKEQLKNNPKVLETKADTEEGGDDQTLTSTYDNSQITSGLKAKQASLEKQKEIAHVRAAFHGAKGATLLALAQGIPDSKGLVEKCAKHITDKVGVQEYLAVLNFTLNPFGAAASIEELFAGDDQWEQMKKERNDHQKDAETSTYPVLATCNSAFSKAQLLLNQDAKQAAIAVAVQAGAEMGTNLITGGMLDKQAKQLGEIIDEVDKFKPEETYTSKVDELDCEKTPGHPFCIQEQATKAKNGGFLENQYTFGDSALVTTAGEAVSKGKGAAQEGGASDTTEAGKIGSIIDSPSSGGGGGFGSYIPQGKVKRGRSGGGGSGRSPSRVRPPGGGGRGKKRARGGARRQSGNGKAVNVAYDGGGKGQYSGGRGRSGKSKGGSKNPFANLFKKGKQKRGKNVLNFRDIAAKDDQRGSIWNMITHRYKETDKKDRLLKYKAVK